MIDYSELVFRVEPMRPDDIHAVMEIEQVAFSAPWSARAYDYELHYNDMAHYFVVRPALAPAPAASSELKRDHAGQEHSPFWQRVWRRKSANPTAHDSQPPVVGYGGMWLMVDEAHISTIASHPEWRRRGIGELLLVAMLERAAEIGANVVTLEVRVSNAAAQSLYKKYGFRVAGRRKGYYSDNGEDALIMSTPSITTASYVRRLEELEAALFARLSK